MEIPHQNGDEKKAELLDQFFRSILGDLTDVDNHLIEAANAERLNDYETQQSDFQTYIIRKTNLKHLHRASLFDPTLVANLTTEPLY